MLLTGTPVAVNSTFSFQWISFESVSPYPGDKASIGALKKSLA